MPNFHFGWRPSQPDIRDEQFKFVPLLSAAALPPSFDLTSPAVGAPFDPCWDQGELGSCGPHTLGENIAYDLIKLDANAANNVMPSRLFIYWNTREIMGTVGSDSGVDNRSMLKALAQFGWCDESLWPYEIYRFTQKPPQACYDQAAQRLKNIKYQSVAQDLATMKSCLYETRRPLLFGFSVYSSMTDSQAVSLTGDVPMPGGLFDQKRGGHDVLIVGYDDGAQRFKFRNHWYNAPGQPWGRNGYGTIPYAYAANPQLAGDFWTVTQVEGEVTPNPTPPPTPAPASVLGLRITIDNKRTLAPTGWQDVGPWPPTK
jgi:C1A family cysteine protease